jgi:hypothetical protein
MDKKRSSLPPPLPPPPPLSIGQCVSEFLDLKKSENRAEIGSIKFRSQPGQIVRGPISKITRAKWTGGMVHVVECLLCKHDVLSSNSSPIKKEI